MLVYVQFIKISKCRTVRMQSDDYSNLQLVLIYLIAYLNDYAMQIIITRKYL